MARSPPLIIANSYSRAQTEYKVQVNIGPTADRQIGLNLTTTPDVRARDEFVLRTVATPAHDRKRLRLSSRGSDSDPADHAQNITILVTTVARLINKRAQNVKAQFAGHPRLRGQIQVRE